MKTTLIATAVILGALVLSSSSCSSTFADICDKEITCEGGNDKDRDACVETLKAAENIASDYDCSDQFDAVVDCSENLTCKDARIDSTPCQTQSQALNACTSAASGKSKGSTSSGGTSSGDTSSSSSSSSSSGG